MLSPDYLQRLGQEIEALYADLEDDLIADITRRIVSTNFQITQSAVWQAEVLQEMGVLRKDILKRVAAASGENVPTIRDLFEQGGTETLAFDDEVYRAAGLKPIPLKQSPKMMQIITASALKCNNELKNLCRTTAAAASTEYRRVCDKAYMQVISGGFDYNTAIRNAVKDAAKTGVRVIYPKGGTAQLDVAIRRAVVTGVNQTAGVIQKMRLDETGAELVETSAHFGARPDHMEWQGQVFYYKEPIEGYKEFVDSTGYGSGDGLMGWNCRHSFFPFFKGISKRAYTDEQLKEMKENSVTYDGKEYTDYKASQMQRSMERDIRKTKREILAVDKARNAEGITPELKQQLNDDYNSASVRLSKQNERLADFLTQTERGEERARVMVNGFDRSHAQASVWAARKTGSEKLKNSVDKSAESGIMKSERGISSKSKTNTFENKVNLEYIQSKEYRKKFESLPYGKATNDTIYKSSKAMLTHRNGTNKEDMYLIEATTGKVVGKQLSSKTEFGVDYNDSLNNAIKKADKHTLISVHNHPTEYPPTGSDFCSMGYRSYHSGVVACNNGKVYWYKIGDKPFLTDTFNKRVIKYTENQYNMSIVDAHLRAMKDFEKEYNIEWREM